MGAASSTRMCEIPIRTGEAIVGLSRVECLQTALLLPVLYRDLSTSRFTSILPDLTRPKKWSHSAAFLRRGFSPDHRRSCFSLLVGQVNSSREPA